MRTEQLVTAGEWRVSTTSGTDIGGVELDVYTIDESKPFGKQVQYEVRKMPFASHDDADRFCLDRGYLQLFSDWKAKRSA